MKMRSFSLLSLFLLFSLLPLLSSARPCATTPLFISVTTTTSTSGDSHLLTVYRTTPLRGPHHLPLPLHRPSSILDRVTDILFVVGGLFFGIVCGAVTASTMYLLWHLFLKEVEKEENEKISPKEMGYVKIPAVTGTKGEGK